MTKGSTIIIGWVNSDDLLLPRSLHKVAHYFISNPDKDCVVGGCVIIDSEGKTIKDRFGLPVFNQGRRVTFNKLLYWGAGFNQPASFWKRKAFFAVGGFDTNLNYCFDYDMYFRLAQQKPFGHLKAFIACFRIHDASKTCTLHDVRHMENEMLMHKYGFYLSTPLSRKIRNFYYQIGYLVMQTIYKLGLLFRKVFGMVDIELMQR